MASLQEQARALGDPTRHRIFRYVADDGSPTGVAELTEHLGLNHNAIRQHLAKLVDAGLVVESRAAPSGPGRPRLVYAVDPRAESRWGVTGPYERLSLLLGEMIRSGESAIEVGRRAGASDAEDTDDLSATVDRINDVMAREGFDPEVRQRRDRTDIVLRNCPFESSALADPDIICQLHLGLAEGVAGDGPIDIVELIAKDPRRAGCRLTLRAGDTGPATGVTFER